MIGSHLTRDEAKAYVGKGWHPLLDELYNALPEEAQVFQVKEKFGGLRFYHSAEDSDFDALVTLAEARSLKLCEACGALAMLDSAAIPNRPEWVKTRCPKHG